MLAFVGKTGMHPLMVQEAVVEWHATNLKDSA